MIKKTLVTLGIITVITTPMIFNSVEAFAASNIATETYTMEYGSINSDKETVFESLLDTVKTYKDENPDISEEDFDKYVETIFEKNAKSNNPNVRGLEDYITGKLNAKEQALYNKNKSKGLLCMANGKLAVNYSKQHYVSSELHNGNGDAFRHALWNYGMAIDVGVSFAKQWSTAHEDGASGQPAIEKKMDLFNNGVGLHQINVHGNPGSISKMIKIIKDRVRAGGCQVIRSGKITNSNSKGEK